MTKTRQWAMLTALACLAILVAGWMLVIKPQRSHAASLRDQAQQVQTANQSLQSQISQLRQQQKDLPAQQKLLSQIATKVPDNPALPTLIRQLSAAADGAGVNLVSMSPGVPAAPTAAAAAGAAAPYMAIPMQLQVQGSYFNIEQFLSSVENLSRAMLVSGISLSPGGSTSGAGPAAAAPGTLQASITASVFESAPTVVAVAPATTTASASTTTVH